MNERFLFALIAVGSVTIFVIGYRTGEMPTRAFTFTRAKYPVIFKVAGAFWLLLALACLWVALTGA